MFHFYKNSLYGLENLSGIPGTVGAGPIQNIGAYGEEIANYIEHIEVFNFKTGNVEILIIRIVILIIEILFLKINIYSLKIFFLG